EAKEQLKSLSSRLQATQTQLRNTQDQRRSLESLFERGYVTKVRLMDLDNRIAQLQADIDGLTSSITVTQNKLDLSGGEPELLPKKRAELAQQAAELRDSIAKTPEVEASLGALMRDYENLKAEYRLAQSKTTLAATGQQMEEDRQA